MTKELEDAKKLAYKLDFPDLVILRQLITKNINECRKLFDWWSLIKINECARSHAVIWGSLLLLLWNIGVHTQHMTVGINDEFGATTSNRKLASMVEWLMYMQVTNPACSTLLLWRKKWN